MSVRKKVIFCTYSSIYSSKVLEQLIVDSEVNLVGIVNSTRVLSPSMHPVSGAITQLKTSGFRYSSYLFFITDFFKWIQPLFVLKKWPLKNVQALADKNNIPIINTRDINTNEVVDFVENRSPDILLCAHFNQLIKAPIFNIKNLACINIHPSLLPKYKGVDPVFFAMRDNADKVGVSVHRMNEHFDSGEILSQSSMQLDTSKSLLFNNCLLFEEGIKLALAWIKNEKQSKSAPIHINQEENNYASWPNREDIKHFKKSGMRLMRISGLWNQQ